MTQTKAQIQLELDTLVGVLRPRMNEIVDIVAVLEASADVHVRNSLAWELLGEVKSLVGELVDNDLGIFSPDTVRGTKETYLALAWRVAQRRRRPGRAGRFRRRPRVAAAMGSVTTNQEGTQDK